MNHTTSVRNMSANENGRGNLAGFEISCPCGFRFGTTLACDVASIRHEHVTVMTRVDAERAAADKKSKTLARRRATIARNADPFGLMEGEMTSRVLAFLYKYGLLPDRRAVRRLETEAAWIAGYRAAVADQQKGMESTR